MDASLQRLADLAGITLFDHQREYLEAALTMAEPQRACLYYKTGAGKSFTSLAGVALWGYDKCVVICPPSTHKHWQELALKLGMTVETISHAKFRMKDTRLSRHIPIIADEMHLFGGQKGQGWRKLDTLAQHLKAPLVLASATPNYNDVERVYCIQHILDPHSVKGGYLQFLYTHCDTEQNPFGMEPRVLGFKNGQSAADYLAALPDVHYLPDDLVITIQDITYDEQVPYALTTYSYNQRKHKLVASQIEMMHTVRYQGLVAEDGCLHPKIEDEISKVYEPRLLIYSNHSTVADATCRSLDRMGLKYAVVTGQTPKLLKETILEEFRWGMHDILVGTATLATGTDGLDRVCNTLLILDDTDDESLRRQLIGRIMPRGDFVSVADKRVVRLVPLSN